MDTLLEGNHTVSGWAIDAAGNPSLPVTAWLVVDYQPPSHELEQAVTTGCWNHVGTTSCNSSVSAVYRLRCNDSSGSSGVATSPCYLDAYVQLAKVWVAQDRHTDSIATAGQGLGAARIARTLRLDGAAVVRSTCLRV